MVERHFPILRLPSASGNGHLVVPELQALTKDFVVNHYTTTAPTVSKHHPLIRSVSEKFLMELKAHTKKQGPIIDVKDEYNLILGLQKASSSRATVSAMIFMLDRKEMGLEPQERFFYRHENSIESLVAIPKNATFDSLGALVEDTAFITKDSYVSFGAIVIERAAVWGQGYVGPNWGVRWADNIYGVGFKPPVDLRRITGD